MSRSLAHSLLQQAEASTLDTLSPEAFVETLVDTIPALSDEFRTITLRVGQRCIPQFLADLERGITLRVFDLALAKDLDRTIVAKTLSPSTYALPRRIRTYAAIYKSVELALPRDNARRLAVDLARGIANRDQSASQLIEAFARGAAHIAPDISDMP